MKSRIPSLRYLVPIVALLILAAQAWPATQPVRTDAEPLPVLVTADWLSRHLDDPDLVILDCTIHIVPGEKGGMKKVSGRADYEKSHIPHARFADLMGDLSDGDSPLDLALPSPAAFCAVMGRLGVSDRSRVVLYDGNLSVWASRVWWMLRWVGFDRAAVLDGGWRAWQAAGLAVSAETDEPRQHQLTLHLRPETIADRDEVFAAIGNDEVRLIDCMPAPHYEGKMVLYSRPGHIPSAINVPTMALLAESGCFQPTETLAALFPDGHDTRVITYCGSGIAASAAAFTLYRLGYTDIAVYAASLQEWAADPENPLVVAEP